MSREFWLDVADLGLIAVSVCVLVSLMRTVLDLHKKEKEHE